MAIIQSKSLQEFINVQTDKWRALQPNITTNTDSMVYMDATVIAELAYLLQSDAITLTNNSFIAYATGDELTNLGLDRGIPRKTAKKSTGLVTFGRNEVGVSDFTIGAGTLVSTEPSSVDGTYISYKTNTDVTLKGKLASPLSPTITKTANVSGYFTPGTYNFAISCFDSNGETEIGTASSIVVTTRSSITLSWSGVANASAYGIYFSNGGAFTKVGSTTGTGYAIPDSGLFPGTSPATVNGTGYLTVSATITAVNTGTSGNVAIGKITNFVTKPTGIDFVTNNTTEATGGTDEESDDAYKVRIRSILSNNTGKVTTEGYRQTALSVQGVAGASVQINGTGQYRNDISIVITSSTGSGVPTPTLLSEVQAVVTSDSNRAVCDNITVIAPTTVSINVSAHITEYDLTYTQSYLISQINTALNSYFPTIPIGGKVYAVNIANIIHDIPGILDFTLTTPSGNVALGSMEMAITGTITITF